MKNIMIVEDERLIAEDIKWILESNGYKVCIIVGTGEEGIAKAKELRPDIILMDIILDGKIDGVEAAKIIYEIQKTPVIFCSASSDEPTMKRIEMVNHSGFISKPFEDEEIIEAVKCVC